MHSSLKKYIEVKRWFFDENSKRLQFNNDLIITSTFKFFIFELGIGGGGSYSFL